MDYLHLIHNISCFQWLHQNYSASRVSSLAIFLFIYYINILQNFQIKVGKEVVLHTEYWLVTLSLIFITTICCLDLILRLNGFIAHCQFLFKSQLLCSTVYLDSSVRLPKCSCQSLLQERYVGIFLSLCVFENIFCCLCT